MYTTIPFVIVILSLGVILIIASRHFKKAASLNLDDIPQEREAVLKRSILENRLLRKVDQIFKIFYGITRPAQGVALKWFKEAGQSLKNLEKSYKFYGVLPDSSKKSEQRSKEKIFQAENEIKKGNLRKAESLYLSAIKICPDSKESYMGLGGVYFKMEEFEQAREAYDYVTKTWPQEDRAFAALGDIEKRNGNFDEAKNYFLHALSINNEIVDYHMDLSEIYIRLDDKEKALSSLQKAQMLEPNNPKILDQLFLVSVLLSNKNLAEEAFEKIKLSNPDHGRIEEFEKKLKEL